MSYFFNGELLVSPAVVSQVNDSAMFNPNPNIGNVLAVLGASTAGKPNTALAFGSADEAVKALGSGDLVDAITRAFDPSAETAAPKSVIAIRVNPALQSTLVLNDAAVAPAINLSSVDYGLYTAQIKVKVEAPSVAGSKLTVQLGNSYYTADNVTRQAFSILYTGAQASATITVNNATQVITLAAPAGTTVATISLATYPTIQQVVDRINTVTGFAATVLGANGAVTALNGLDTVATQDCKTAVFNVVANLQAAIDWFNSKASGGLVTATRATNAGLPPAPIPFTYLAGGTDGAITNTQWSNAFAALQSVAVQWVVPCSTDPAIHAMTDAHVVYMSAVGRKRRRAICGSPLATSDTAAIALALAINSDRTSYVHLGMYDYNAAGALTLYQPFVLAAMIAGAFCGLNPGTPMTNKSLKIRGLERTLRDPTDTDPLILGGVMPIESTPTGYRVTKSISTWLTNANYNRVEQSCGVAVDYTSTAVEQALAKYKGSRGDYITLSAVAADTETALRQLAKPYPSGLGVLVGDANSPPYKNITATLSADVITVAFQCSPVIPANYVAATINVVPYAGSVSV